MVSNYLLDHLFSATCALDYDTLKKALDCQKLICLGFFESRSRKRDKPSGVSIERETLFGQNKLNVLMRKRRKNNKKARYFILLVILSGIIFYAPSKIYSIFGNEIKKIVLKGNVFHVEIVDTEPKRDLGLGGRKELCQECGMLFIFPENGNHPFWMKDMNFPLDIIWLEKGKVVKIERNIPYASVEVFSPNAHSDQVLEFNAGISDSLGIAEGDIIW